MTQMMTRGDQIKSVRDLLEKCKPQITMALPKHLTPDRMTRIVMTSVQRTPKLLDCEPKSLMSAVIECSQLGLMPDGILGHAYLIPYGKTVQLIPGYKGLIDLARRSGQISSISSRIVYENDDFSFSYGLDEELKHKPTDSDRGKMKYAYAVARFKDGGVAFEVLNEKDILDVKKSSKAASSGPWVTHPAEMWKKTAIRKLCKYLPLSPEMQRAVTLDEMGEQGLPQFVDGDIIDTTAEEAVPQKSKEDELLDKISGEDGKGEESPAETTNNTVAAEQSTAIYNMLSSIIPKTQAKKVKTQLLEKFKIEKVEDLKEGYFPHACEWLEAWGAK